MLHTRMIGQCKVSSVVEYFGPTHVPEKTFPEFDRTAVEANRAWLVPNHWIPEMDRFIIAIQIWIVETGSSVVLVDTGVGNRKPRTVERMNMLNSLVPQWLEAAGATREKVTHVAMTHLHSDHVGWNTVWEDGRWVPTFPNARYLVPKENFDYWKGLIDSGAGAPDGGSFADSVLPVVEAGMVEFIDQQKEVAGCLAVEPLPGHTPGHLNFRLRSGGEEGLFAGDVMHHPIQIVCPTWNSAFCIAPDLARRSRATFLAQAAKSGVLVMPCHFGPPHCGYVRKQGNGYRFEPAVWD
jgi:glyoxylase-like metal-dependent hydrolase (beta-lactamase superfamily II)